MKTPIQELIEIVERSKKDQPQPHFWKHEVLELLNLTFDKEKEAIQQAFYEGMLCQGFDPNMGRAEKYYNEVYKGNEELKDRKVWDALNEQWDLSKNND